MSLLPYYLKNCLQAQSGTSGDCGSSSPDLDLENPKNNLYAIGKLWATYADEPMLPPETD